MLSFLKWNISSFLHSIPEAAEEEVLIIIAVQTIAVYSDACRYVLLRGEGISNFKKKKTNPAW